MGGVTRRRADQVLHSLTKRCLVRADGQLHVLTDEGLTHLARRDRASVSMTLSRWSAKTGRHRHKQGRQQGLLSITGPRSESWHPSWNTTPESRTSLPRLTAEVARKPVYELLDIMPTSRSTAGYRYMGTNFVVHPDASFHLGYMGQWHPYFLEYERRATTPKRVPRQAGVLPTLLPEWMGPQGPRRDPAQGPVRVRDTRRGEYLPACCFKAGPSTHYQHQSTSTHPHWRVG